MISLSCMRTTASERRRANWRASSLSPTASVSPPPRRLVVDFTSLRQIGGSSLTDRSIPVRHGDPEKGVVPSSYVPFRNAHLLAASTSWAEVLGATAIFVGAVEADSSGYPDCRPAFFAAFARAIRLGTKADTNIAVLTPVISMSKADIIRQRDRPRCSLRRHLVVLRGER